MAQKFIFCLTNSTAGNLFGMPAYRLLFFISPIISNQQHTVFYKLMCWLAGSLTCRLPNVVRSPPARRSRKFIHYWLMFGSSLTRLYNTQRRTTDGRTPLDEWSARHVINWKLCHFVINVVFVDGMIYHYHKYLVYDSFCVDFWCLLFGLHSRPMLQPVYTVCVLVLLFT